MYNNKILMEYCKKLKILYVEDNEDTRTAILKILGNIFNEIIVAVDGVEGLDKFKNNKIDIVITDLNMPQMNGIEMVKSIKEINSKVPIFIFTAYNESRYLMDAISLGIDGYLLKPINATQFFKALYKSIENIKLKNENESYRDKLEEKVQLQLEQLRERDKQLMYKNKLTQMGELLSMIAHQWRQPLNAISLTVNNLAVKCAFNKYDKQVFKKELELINTYSQHLSSTIDDFRGFFKENKTKETTSIPKIINSTLNINQTSL
jgi:YesN/AraC family two-component response regulator